MFCVETATGIGGANGVLTDRVRHMNLVVRNRSGVVVLAFLAGLLSLLLSAAIMLFGLPVVPVLMLVPPLVVLALAAAAARMIISKRQERLAKLMLATAALCITSAVAFLRLLDMEGHLVSEARSTAVVDAFLWPALTFAVVAYVALLLMGARLLTLPSQRTTLPRP
jgi:hypothetical protein